MNALHVLFAPALVGIIVIGYIEIRGALTKNSNL